VAYVGWLAMERETGKWSLSAASFAHYLSDVRVAAKSFVDSQEALTAGIMFILQALVREYRQRDARSFPCLTHCGGVSPYVVKVIWANAMKLAERVMIRDAAAVILDYVLGLVRHDTTRGEHYARSGKDDRSTGVSERQGIAARGNGNTDKSCFLTIAHRLVADADCSKA
jgi:hypothetical protein